MQTSWLYEEFPEITSRLGQTDEFAKVRVKSVHFMVKALHIIVDDPICMFIT